MIGAAVTAQIVDKPSRVDIVDFQAIWLRGQDVAARNGRLLFDKWTQRMKKGRQGHHKFRPKYAIKNQTKLHVLSSFSTIFSYT